MSFYKNREQEGKTGALCGVVNSGRREGIRNWRRSMNMVKIFHIHVCKWNETY
jgi:hypothetical protein